MPAAFSSFDYIYPGPLMDDYGFFDERIWFFIPIESDEDGRVLVYLKFPFGGTEDEFTEEKV
jgi:hypothetical protein